MENNLKGSFETYLIVFGAEVMSAIFVMAVGFLLQNTGELTSGLLVQGMMYWMLMGLAGGCVAGVYFLKQSLFPDAMSKDGKATGKLRKKDFPKAVVLSALGEVPAMLGLIFLVMGGEFGELIVFAGCSAAAFFIGFLPRELWESEKT